MYNHKHWTDKHQEEALKADWGVFAVDGDVNRLEIQRLDETEVFESDAEALEFIKNEFKNKDVVLLDGKTYAEWYPFEFETYEIALTITGNL